MASTLFAANGYEVYKKNCMACHAKMMTEEYALAHLNELIAPPIVEVSARLKENIKTTDEEYDNSEAELH